MMRHTSYVAAAAALVGLAAFPVALTAQGAGGARIGRDAEDSGLPLDRWQPKRLPALPAGMTLDMIRAGDSLYRGKGGCVTCHGPNVFGMPNSGSGLTLGLHFIPAEWGAIDSLVTAGIPEAVARSSVAMPGRGIGQNLTPDETRQVAAYVWAIARVAGEPWPGGHRTHEGGATSGNAAAGGRTP